MSAMRSLRAIAAMSPGINRALSGSRYTRTASRMSASKSPFVEPVSGIRDLVDDSLHRVGDQRFPRRPVPVDGLLPTSARAATPSIVRASYPTSRSNARVAPRMASWAAALLGRPRGRGAARCRDGLRPILLYDSRACHISKVVSRYRIRKRVIYTAHFASIPRSCGRNSPCASKGRVVCLP